MCNLFRFPQHFAGDKWPEFTSKLCHFHHRHNNISRMKYSLNGNRSEINVRKCKLSNLLYLNRKVYFKLEYATFSLRKRYMSICWQRIGDKLFHRLISYAWVGMKHWSAVECQRSQKRKEGPLKIGFNHQYIPLTFFDCAKERIFAQVFQYHTTGTNELFKSSINLIGTWQNFVHLISLTRDEFWWLII